MKKFNPVDGPLPGANFLSDTKGRAWHQPPKHNNIDSAMEAVYKRLLDKKRSFKIITALEMGVPVAVLTDIFLTMGISRGDWTPDFALLLAGPTSHVMKMMAESYGIQYSMGIDEEKEAPTSTHYKGLSELSDPKKIEAMIKEVKAKEEEVNLSQESESNGFMGGLA